MRKASRCVGASLSGVSRLLAQCQIADEHKALRYRQRLARAEKEFELARRRLEIFNEMTSPNRLTRAELSLEAAGDDLLEARAELERLRQECDASEPGDTQRAARVERAERAVERQQREFELRKQELYNLREVLLPLEAMELQLEADRRKQAVLELHWDNEAALLDRRVALLEAEELVERLENELADLMRQMALSADPKNGQSAERPRAPAVDKETSTDERPQQ